MVKGRLEPRGPRSPSASTALPRPRSQASPQLQEAGSVAVDGGTQLAQCVVERHIWEFLQGGTAWAWGSWQKGQVGTVEPCCPVPSPPR
jgi:hypothetical protein